jgi:hypothetical protein
VTELGRGRLVVDADREVVDAHADAALAGDAGAALGCGSRLTAHGSRIMAWVVHEATRGWRRSDGACFGVT